MANTNSQVQSVQFSVNWTIKWSEFAKISSSSDVGKVFITSYNNVPFLWRASLSVPSNDSPGIDFFLYYRNGPIEKFGNMEYAISIVKPDSSIAKTQTTSSYEAKRCSDWGWDEYFDEKDPVAFRAKYGLKETDPLLIRITMKIPITVFDFAPPASPPASLPNWMTDLFAEIQDPEKSIFWSAKLISRDGDKFYCHKVIAFQSEPLRAMFRHPPPPGKPENEYEFPRLGSASLKALIRYLYTGQADLANLAAKDLIELADTAEMYNLKPLKGACSLVLWKNVVNSPDSSPEILRFASLHDDLKDLKHRAMDVMAENFEMLSVRGIFGQAWFGNGYRADLLRHEVMLFMARRLSMGNLVG